MRYYKYIEDDYIKGVGIGCGGNEISENEYNEIMELIANKPISNVYGYKLKTDYTWEEYELPPKEDNATEEDYLEALEKLGVSE